MRPLSANALEALQLLQNDSFQDVARLKIAPELAMELERHLREAVHYALDRDVRSAAFLDEVRRPSRVQSTRGAGLR